MCKCRFYGCITNPTLERINDDSVFRIGNSVDINYDINVVSLKLVAGQFHVL